MNARDRLRLYLEQRRELGESELVLDTLSVEAVLKMVGAPVNVTPAPKQPPIETIAPRERPSLAPASDGTPQAPPEPAPRFDETIATDWRTAIRGLAPPAEQQLAAASAEGAQRDKTAPVPPTLPAAFPSWLINLGIPIGLTANALTQGPTSAVAATLGSLEDVAATVAVCRACALGELALNPVAGEGNPTADLVCVGEAPGQTEDETGRPFIGAAGQLLTKILAAIELQRGDVFICNVLKHRPPGNRNPAPDEIRACTPYLTRQLTLLQPKVILALGTFAAQTLLNTTTPLGKLRGQVHRYQGIPLIVTYHPAALLRNESWKRPTWDDVKLARRILDAARAA